MPCAPCRACGGSGRGRYAPRSRPFWLQPFRRRLPCDACGGDGCAKPPGWPDPAAMARLRPTPPPAPPPPRVGPPVIFLVPASNRSAETMPPSRRSPTNDRRRSWNRLARNLLVDRRITDAGYRDDPDGIPELVLTLDDGTELRPLSDDEGNAPGALRVDDALLPVLLPVLHPVLRID